MKNKKTQIGQGKIRGYWLPFLIALPFAVLIAFAVIRYGTVLRNLIHVAIKAVVLA